MESSEPKVGDTVYIPTNFSITSVGKRLVTGEKTVIAGVRNVADSEGKQHKYIITRADPDTPYNWRALFSQQAELKELLKDDVAEFVQRMS